MSLFIDTSDAGRVGEALASAAVRTGTALGLVLAESAMELRDDWRSSATATAGKHGKHYPKSITLEQTGALEIEVGPDSSMPQGGMSFEYGSVNQPPHLDGQKAADKIEALIEAKVAKALAAVGL